MLAIVTDPAFQLVIRLALALVFGVGVIHKARDLKAFQSTVENYRLLPAPGTVVAAPTFIIAEMVVVLLLLFNHAVAGPAAALLLSLYSIAISINLIRGRKDIDCGCSGPAMRQTLSVWLVFRNLLLILMASVLAMPQTDRLLQPLDWFSGITGVLGFALLYYAADRLTDTGRRLRA